MRRRRNCEKSKAWSWRNFYYSNIKWNSLNLIDFIDLERRNRSFRENFHLLKASKAMNRNREKFHGYLLSYKRVLAGFKQFIMFQVSFWSHEEAALVAMEFIYRWVELLNHISNFFIIVPLPLQSIISV